MNRHWLVILSGLLATGHPAAAGTPQLAAGEIVTPVTPGGETVTPVVPSPGGTGQQIVTPVQPGPSSSEVRVQPSAPGQIVWLTRDLKLRQTPGSKGKVLGLVKAGTGMTVKGQTVDTIDGYRWLQVEGDGKAGFIANLNLSKTQPKRRGTPT